MPFPSGCGNGLAATRGRVNGATGELALQQVCEAGERDRGDIGVLPALDRSGPRITLDDEFVGVAEQPSDAAGTPYEDAVTVERPGEELPFLRVRAQHGLEAGGDETRGDGIDLADGRLCVHFHPSRVAEPVGLENLNQERVHTVRPGIRCGIDPHVRADVDATREVGGGQGEIVEIHIVGAILEISGWTARPAPVSDRGKSHTALTLILTTTVRI